MRSTIFILFAILFSVSLCIEAQTIQPAVVNTSGSSVANASIEYYYSIGEPVTSTLQSSSNYVTLGVLQPQVSCSLTNLTISGSPTFCVGQGSLTYFLTNTTLGSLYNWTVTGGLQIISGQGTGQLVVLPVSTSLGGSLSVMETNGICQGNVASISLVSTVPSYIITDANIPCDNASFQISLNTLKQVSPGILGLDLCLSYNPSVLTTSGVVTLGNVITRGNPSWATYIANPNQSGILRVSAYYTSLAPSTAQFSGLGTVLSVNFTARPGVPIGTRTSISVCSLQEASIFGTTSSSFCGTISSQVNFTNAISNFSGQIVYSGTNLPLASNGILGAPNATYIAGADLLCNTTSSPIQTSSTGAFNFNIANGSAIRLSKEIVGNYLFAGTVPSVLAAINGSDALLAASIGINLINPTIYQTIAADVNLDGKVSALDASLISRRSVLIDLEFPQAWNYNGFIPIAPARKSSDWLFFFNSTLTINSFSATNVPKAPNCLALQLPATVCPAIVPSQTITGILLGDVDASYTLANSPNLRTSNVQEILFDLSQSKKSGVSYIPVSFTSDTTVNSLDFAMDIDTSIIQILEVQTSSRLLSNAIQVSWNNFKGQTLYLSSYSLRNYEAQDSIFYLKVLVNKPSEISKAFVPQEGYLNGKSSSLRVSESQLVTGLDIWQNSFVIAPNPFQSSFTIKTSKPQGTTIYRILDITGREVAQGTLFSEPFSKSDEIWPLDLSNGLFYLELNNGTYKATYKLIHDK